MKEKSDGKETSRGDRPGGCGGNIYGIRAEGKRERGGPSPTCCGRVNEIGNYDGAIRKTRKGKRAKFDAPSVGNSPPSQGLEEPHPRGRTMAGKTGAQIWRAEDRRTRREIRKLGGGKFIGCFESVSWSLGWGEGGDEVWRARSD
ncbi:hypothetical protein BO71DRAFT_82399 [Aspergillus ellipticus CBS 707.79]|uniref:Uncharacterized protein n=1 Tax=Aspergillus ellipticus CBS 707.79 TaxID=1448320 RepID=A0A319CZ53_9EURO|nr:hypothetical protein BO71DRAFT_82399 [Aspergillus ellipticus CBS 707.79]